MYTYFYINFFPHYLPMVFKFLFLEYNISDAAGHINIYPLEQVHFDFNLLTIFKLFLSGKYFFT